MRNNITVQLRGYVYTNPTRPDPENRPNAVKLTLILNKGYKNPITDEREEPILYSCFTQNKKEADQIMKFVKKDMFLYVKGAPNRPHVKKLENGKHIVHIKIAIRNFDILTVIDQEELDLVKRISENLVRLPEISNIDELEEEECIGNY